MTYKQIAESQDLNKRQKFESILTKKAKASKNPYTLGIYFEQIEKLFEAHENPRMEECFKFFLANNKQDGFEIKQLDLIFN